jgi:ribose 5-phosphate isomerase A
MPSIHERALALVKPGDTVGLGSGRAASAFVRALGERVRAGLNVKGVPTSEATAALARENGIPLVTLADGIPLALTVDGADEVSPALDLIKGYGRALVREKVVAAASGRLVILVGAEKKVTALGERGRLPVEALPFAVPLVRERIRGMGLTSSVDTRDGRMFLSDNGNAVLDVVVGPIPDPAWLDRDLQAIPGVVGTGLFVRMEPLVLVGDETKDFELIEELGGE